MTNYPYGPSPVDGEKILVPPPSGLTAVDTPAIQGAIGRLTAAGGNGTIQFQDGVYQVDSNALVIQTCSNFAVKGTGATVISQAPNRAALPNNTTGDLFVIADSTDFRVEDMIFDGLRDTVAPITALSATATSGQAALTVAAGTGSRYQVGQRLNVFGGIGTTDSNLSDGFSPGGGSGGKIVQSINPGGGSGGGDLITFTTNLANSYTQGIPGANLSDGFGPYANGGAYVTPYQVGSSNSVAGRTLSGEDQQNGLHLLNCTRFVVSRVTARNLWESPIKLGTGFEPASASLTDGCTSGTVTDCIGYHAYDQGVSVWVSNNITVKGCVLNAAGWAGVSLTAANQCTVVGNQIINSIYRVPTDNNSGSGIASEGGQQNTIKGNIITTPWSDGIRLTGSPLGWGAFGSGSPTTSTFLAGQLAAGTSVQISATGSLIVNGLYSIIDGARTEAVTVASIIDGTHVTFAAALMFSHPAGVHLNQRMDQENLLEGNTITSPNQGDGVNITGAVRSIIKNNVFRNWSTGATGAPNGSGVVLVFNNSNLPATVYIGGDGSQIEGNYFGGGLNQGIVVDSIASLIIRGNKIYGNLGTNPGINLKGITDSLIADNYISDIEQAQGIFLQAGTLAATVPARVTITGNVINRCNNEGIIATAGDSLSITGNVCTSNGSHAGINLRTVTRSIVMGNVCNSNAAAGIELESTCTSCLVMGNIARDDGSGIKVSTGAAQTQVNGLLEASASNNNLWAFNEADANSTAQLSLVGAGNATAYNVLTAAVGGLATPEGSNTKQGTATLVAGTVVVANTSVTANSRIFLTPQDNNTAGALRVSARTAGTSFTILSSNGADTGVVAYEIFEPG